ncbi:hypothetical protein B0T20DRAFT_482956 [Sordaria brevicollis]|uniref:Uncharacterized protein n=1 Tax=Sordaria brevicollis TaxID=83679 RepID=A0AAE0P1X1_SORBR|nr:hypothetical protein B0T20DRAFT_482956 [Sordaria brevicollis]
MASPEEDDLFGDKELEELQNTQAPADNVPPPPQGTAANAPAPQTTAGGGWNAFLSQQAARINRHRAPQGEQEAVALQQPAHGQDGLPVDPQLEAYAQQLSSDIGHFHQPAQKQQEDYNPNEDDELAALLDEWHNEEYGNLEPSPADNFAAQNHFNNVNTPPPQHAPIVAPDAGNHNGQQDIPGVDPSVSGSVDYSLWAPAGSDESLLSSISAYMRRSPPQPAASAAAGNGDGQSSTLAGHQPDQRVTGADYLPGGALYQPQYGNGQFNPDLGNEAQGQTVVAQQQQGQNQQYIGSQAAPGGLDGQAHTGNQQFNQNQGTQNNQAGAFQQQYHDNQPFTGSHAAPGNANNHFDPHNTQNNQNNGAHNGQGSAFQQNYPEPPNQQVGEQQGAPTGVSGYQYPDPPQQPVNQFNNAQGNLPQWGHDGQYNPTQQQYGVAHTGQNQGNTGTQFNNHGQQAQGNRDQFNNGNQQLNNGQHQYGQQDAAIDLLNLGGAQAGQVVDSTQYNNFQTGQPQGAMGGQPNNGDQQFNNNHQYGQVDAAVDLLNLGGGQAAHGIGIGQFDNQPQQQPNNGQTAQGGTAGFNKTNNGYQQYGNGAQTVQGVGGPQYNQGSQPPSQAPSQPPSREQTPSVGLGISYNQGNQQNNWNNLPPIPEEGTFDLLNLPGQQHQQQQQQQQQPVGGGQYNYESQQASQNPSRVPTPLEGNGGYMAPGNNQQANQFSNGSQQPSRVTTPMGNHGGYMAPGNNQQVNQFNNGSQQPSRTVTPQAPQGGYLAPGQQPLNQNNGMQYGQGVAGGQSNNGSQQATREPTPQGGMGGQLPPGAQPFNQNNGMQNVQGGAGSYLDAGNQQFNNQQPQQGAAGGYVNPMQYNNQQAGFPNAAGGDNQYLQPGNHQQPAGSLYGGGGGVAQPGGQGQQFGAAGQNSNAGTPGPDQPPALGSAPPEPRPPPVVTPPVFPAGTPQPERWVAPGGNETVKIKAPKFRVQHGIHPHSVYYHHTQTPAWGTEYDSQTGQPRPPIFSYCNSQPQARAELVQNKTYTTQQLAMFFRGDGHPNRLNRHLTAWIQNVPLMVSDRYAQKDAGKCRYSGCAAAPNYTIIKGFHRVALDEYSHHTGDWYDPYNNAGYMHLWCFEHAFDFGYLVWDVELRPQRYNNFRIEADVRHHRFEEQNKASLNRDHNLHDTFREWKNEQWGRYVQIRHQEAQTGVPHDPYQAIEGIHNDSRLWRRLTDKHIAEEVPARQRNRKARVPDGTPGANTIGQHRGDLAQYIRVDRAKRNGGNNSNNSNNSNVNNGGSQVGNASNHGGSNHGGSNHGGSHPSTPAPAPKRKRGNGTADDGDEDYEDDGEASAPGTKRARTTAGTQTMQPPPTPTPRRTTRRSSMALAHNLEVELTTNTQSPLTRSRAHFLNNQLNQLPPHMQQDVISHVPAETISPVLLLQNWRPENWGEVLRERVGRMTPYHQGLLAAVADKMDKKAGVDGGVGKRRWRSDP